MANKYHPILFSSQMVNAIRENRKTWTRRIIKPPPIISNDGYVYFDKYKSRVGFYALAIELRHRCKYNIGDILWVREGFILNYFDGGLPAYKADWNSTAAEYCPKPKFKPSIHMPKSACRIFLEITDLQFERIQDIKSFEAICEGIEICKNDPRCAPVYKFYGNNPGYTLSAVGSFRSLWNSINGDDSWDENPFVTVIQFKRVEMPSDFLDRDIELQSTKK